MRDLIGRTLGQYRIVEQLGKGGMATVFKAFQPSLERYVAIKVLPPYFAHEEGFSERFVREARAIARLDHPHILPIYDYGQDGEYSYLVIKYVDAGTLKDVEAGGPLSLSRAAEVLSQTAEALDYAHGQGLIHRDIKPANILMDRGQWVLLADFGLAKMMEGSQQLTASGVGIGTPAYMAPEQGQGQPVDCRADIYSLGIVLYEMLTGRVPFEAETPLAVVLKHVTEPLTMPRWINPDIPEAVELVILKALAKEPADRYQTAGQMAAALHEAIETSSMSDLFRVPESFQETRAEAPSPASLDVSPETVPDLPSETASDALAAPAVLAAEVGVETAPTSLPETKPDVLLPAAEDARAPLQAVPVAPEPASVPTSVPKAAPGRRMPRWAFILAGLLVLGLLVSGGVLVRRGLYKRFALRATATAAAGDRTALGPTATVGRPVNAAPVKPLRLGLIRRAYIDVDGGREALSAYLAGQADLPVKVIVIDDVSAVAGMLQAQEVDVVPLQVAEYVWLSADGHVSPEPLLYMPPLMRADLFVRLDGPVQSVADLRGRRVALASWNSYAGIMGVAALMEQGLNLREETQVIYMGPDFTAEVDIQGIEALASGRVDAAVLSSDALERAREAVPGAAKAIHSLGQSNTSAWAVLAASPDLPAERRELLSRLLLDAGDETVRGLSPFGAMIEAREPFAENFAGALGIVQIMPVQLVENTPPEFVRSSQPQEPAAPGQRLALVTEPGMVLDRNRFVRPMWQMVQRRGPELGIEIAGVQAPPQGNPRETADQLLQEGYTTIVGVYWQDQESFLVLAQGHPQTTFVYFGGLYQEGLPNLQAFSWRLRETGFLAGALAGQASEKKVVGVVFGPSAASTEDLVSGFERGVAHSCPGCRVVVVGVDSFTDLDQGAAAGRSLVDKGADVVFNGAGNAGSAAIQAAAQMGAWVIGIDWDEYVGIFDEGGAPGADRLLGSVVLRLEREMEKVLEGLAAGRFEPGMHSLSIAEGGIEYVPAPKAAHPDKPQLDRYVQDLIQAVRDGQVQP